MNQTAKDLFTDWYSAALKKDVTSEELKPKREALDKLVTEASSEVWVDVINIYLGFFDENNDGFKRIAKVFKEIDEYFPLKSVNLLRVLCGCLMAEKIDKNDDWACDLVALAVIIHPQKGDGIIPELLSRAKVYYINECESVRKMKVPNGSELIKSSPGKTAIPTMEDESGIPDFVKQLSSYLTASSKDMTQLIVAINQVVEQNKSISDSFIALKEEVDMLWWLFGQYSDIVKKPFSELPLLLLSVLSAIELGALTELLPGAGKIIPIITKTLSCTKGSLTEAATLENFVLSTHTYQKEIQSRIDDFPDSLKMITPLLTSLKTYFQYSGGEWKNAVSAYHFIDLSETKLPVNFTEQLYMEIMLINTYKLLN